VANGFYAASPADEKKCPDLEVNILLKIDDVTAKVKEETERVDHAIHSTIDRIDDTAGRVRSNVRAKTSALVGFLRGARTAMASVLRTEVRT